MSGKEIIAYMYEHDGMIHDTYTGEFSAIIVPKNKRWTKCEEPWTETALVRSDDKPVARVVNRDELGRLVRDVWISWAKEQAIAKLKSNWLIPYDELDEPDKEVDRRIGETLYQLGASQLQAAPAKPVVAGRESRRPIGFFNSNRPGHIQWESGAFLTRAKDGDPIYGSAPSEAPAVVVPDRLPQPKMVPDQEVALSVMYAKGWNKCIDAMLEANPHSSQQNAPELLTWLKSLLDDYEKQAHLNGFTPDTSLKMVRAAIAHQSSHDDKDNENG